MTDLAKIRALMSIATSSNAMRALQEAIAEAGTSKVARQYIQSHIEDEPYFEAVFQTEEEVDDEASPAPPSAWTELVGWTAVQALIEEFNASTVPASRARAAIEALPPESPNATLAEFLVQEVSQDDEEWGVTVQALAQELSDSIVPLMLHGREGEEPVAAEPREGVPRYTLRDNAPDWMLDAVREAGGGAFPSDWGYYLVAQAAQWLAELGPREIANREFGDAAYRQVDDGNHRLALWLAHDPEAYASVDEYTENFGAPDGIFQMLQGGQYQRIQNVMNYLVDPLEEQADPDNVVEGLVELLEEEDEATEG
jgi:hypothetical protein